MTEASFAALLPVLLLFVLPAPAGSQTLYKYRDESGRWVFSDRRPAGEQAYERSLRTPRASGEPGVTVHREQSENGVDLVAVNTCECPMEVGIVFTSASNVSRSAGEMVRAVLPAGDETSVVTVRPLESASPWSFEFEYGYIFGDPDANHRTGALYRPPFAAGKKYAVTQAYPEQFTHDTPDSRHAVDIAMPEQSGVYAAREGLVVSVAYSNFRGGADREQFGARANVVKILHDDGTFGIYAHLSWDSIRVRVGRRVARGEYIADSGNTGFTTGPHLHFVVVRNDGLKMVSVPVTFSGGPGEVVQPRTGSSLRNP